MDKVLATKINTIYWLTFWVFIVLKLTISSLKFLFSELLLCRKCGTDIADSYYLFSKSSPGAQKVEKQNLFGRQNVTVQSLVNPFGVKFEIVTIEKTRCKIIGSVSKF